MCHKTNICPLCGGPNECSLAPFGSVDNPCWCREVTVNPAAISLAEQSKKDKSCICQQCAVAITSNSGMRLVETRLYCAEHCHLCDEAKSVISNAGVVAQSIDIIENANFFEKYRLRIPVLQRVDNNTELDWPFDALSLSRFLM